MCEARSVKRHAAAKLAISTKTLYVYMNKYRIPYDYDKER